MFATGGNIRSNCVEISFGDLLCLDQLHQRKHFLTNNECIFNLTVMESTTKGFRMLYYMTTAPRTHR